MKQQSKRFNGLALLTEVKNPFLNIYFSGQYVHETVRLKFGIQHNTLRLIIAASYVQEKAERAALAQEIATLTKFNPKSIYNRLKRSEKNGFFTSRKEYSLKGRPKGFHLTGLGHSIASMFFTAMKANQREYDSYMRDIIRKLHT